MSWNAWATSELALLREAHRHRHCTAPDAKLISFASNDYLGLSVHPAVRDAAIAAVNRCGVGARASRLVTGTHELHIELESTLARWQRTEQALAFPTGFAANLGVLTVLGANAIIFSDQLNHASIIDGCRLARSPTHIYRHCDLNHLAALLQETSGPKVVVSDVVFSMDGDVAPITELSELCADHGALLVLDEAHAVLQPIIESLPCEFLKVGTLSKTLGSMGGWVAGSAAIIELLANRARSFVFTTGLSIPDAAAALAALQLLMSADGEALKATLRANVNRLRPLHSSPIVPLIFGSESSALVAAEHLRANGLYSPAIRPPTVAPGTSRLRITLSAAHSESDMARLERTLASLPCNPRIEAQHQ